MVLDDVLSSNYRWIFTIKVFGFVFFFGFLVFCFFFSRERLETLKPSK